MAFDPTSYQSYTPYAPCQNMHTIQQSLQNESNKFVVLLQQLVLVQYQLYMKSVGQPGKAGS